MLSGVGQTAELTLLFPHGRNTTFCLSELYRLPYVLPCTYPVTVADAKAASGKLPPAGPLQFDWGFDEFDQVSPNISRFPVSCWVRKKSHMKAKASAAASIVLGSLGFVMSSQLASVGETVKQGSA